MIYDPKTGTVIYRCTARHLETQFPAPAGGQWQKFLLAHISDKYEHLVRYYG